MKVLLDTHVWIWWLLGSERLSPPERRSLDQGAAAGGCHLEGRRMFSLDSMAAIPPSADALPELDQPAPAMP